MCAQVCLKVEQELIEFLKKQSAAYEVLLAQFNEEKENRPDNSAQRLMDSVEKKNQRICV